MTEYRSWSQAAGSACERNRRVVCGPTGTGRDSLAGEFQQVHTWAVFRPASCGHADERPTAQLSRRPTPISRWTPSVAQFGGFD